MIIVPTSNTWCLNFKEYPIIGIEDNIWYRILNEIDEPCLYHESDLRVVSPERPAFWSVRRSCGIPRIYPPEFSDVNYFSDLLENRNRLSFKVMYNKYYISKPKRFLVDYNLSNYEYY